MKREDRKAAVAAYKERKVAAGVYVVRCAATGQQWVGSAPDLATIWNRLTFMLRQNNATSRSLQAAWRDHGGDSFSFAILEQVDLEKALLPRDDALRERLEHWRAALGVEGI